MKTLQELKTELDALNAKVDANGLTGWTRQESREFSDKVRSLKRQIAALEKEQG